MAQFTQEELSTWLSSQVESGQIEKFILATWSSPIEKEYAKSVQARFVKIAEKLKLQVVYFEQKRSLTKNYDLEKTRELFVQLASCYRMLFVRTQASEFTFTQIKDGTFRKKEKKLKSENSCKQVDQESYLHNRKKNIAFQEGVPVDAFVELGIMTQEGQVKTAARAKFNQINRFIELIKQALDHFEKGAHLHIVDMGCGKAYLTFALYAYLNTCTAFKATVVGIDLKKDVVEFCNKLAEKLRFTGLSFRCQDVKTFTPEQTQDMVIALHACDTATDVAIGCGVKWGAKAIFVAPCCQQEILPQLQTKAFPILLKHGLFRERFAALLTDAMRAELLECVGYDVSVIEFVDPEHTPKNIMLRALKTKYKRHEKSQVYQDVQAQFQLRHTLEKQLEEFLD